MGEEDGCVGVDLSETTISFDQNAFHHPGQNGS